MLKGVFYNAIAKYSGVIFSIIITAILSRLLSPKEFGIVALVTVFITFFNLLGNMGIGPAIVQQKKISEDDLASIFGFSIYMAALLALSFFLSAGLISSFYDEPNLIPVVQLLSLNVFFNICSIVPRALNKRKLKFKEMGIVNIGIQVVTGGLAILLAYMDYSYYAIIIQSLISAFLLFLVFYILHPIKFTFLIRKDPLKRIASYSSFQFGYNMMNYFSRNLDSILIGKFLGNAPLGYYNKSYMLMQLPVYNLTHVITPVMHPVLSKFQDDLDYIYKSYYRVVKILASIGFPLSIFMYFSASPLILLMFGSQWEQSIPVFEILAFSVGIQMCSSSTNAIYQARNKTNLLFLTGCITFVLLVSGIVYGIFYGKSLEAVGMGLLIAFILNFLQDFYFVIKHALNKSFLHFIKVFSLPIIFSLLSFGIYYAISFLNFESKIVDLILNAIILLLILTVVFMIPKDNRKFFLGFINKPKVESKTDNSA